ncbi:hypothetical protein [Streptomyces sp. CB02923]|uniref:hypothetical protein n=1 Tax=Streptomyces sp. CB02923 TaxID=1718985 RepID=UPI0018FFEE5A|nr:hypothetical protein [Streptomyces sp. CB02923]
MGVADGGHGGGQEEDGNGEVLHAGGWSVGWAGDVGQAGAPVGEAEGAMEVEGAAGTGFGVGARV